MDFTSACLFAGSRSTRAAQLRSPTAIGMRWARDQRERRQLGQHPFDRVGGQLVRIGLLRVSDVHDRQGEAAASLHIITSPADSFATVKELAVFAFDDSASAFPLNPKVILAFELGDGEADGSREQRDVSRAWRSSDFELSTKSHARGRSEDGPQRRSLLRGTDGQQHVRLLRCQRAAQRAGDCRERRIARGARRRRLLQPGR